MLRVLIASVIGAVLLFVWGFASWMLLDWRSDFMIGLPNDTAVMPVLKENLPKSGMYMFPAMPADWRDKEAMELFEQQHAVGPVGMIIYESEGSKAMPPSAYATGMTINFIIALVSACLVYLTSKSCACFTSRFTVIFLLAVLVIATAELIPWNWMPGHDRFTLINAIDHLIGFALMGVPICLLIKPPKAPSVS